jgi:uncharacterized protein YkwD
LFAGLSRKSLAGAVAIGVAAGGVLYVVDRQVGKSIRTLEIGIAFSQPDVGDGQTVASAPPSTEAPAPPSTTVQTTVISTTTTVPLPADVDQTWRQEVLKLTNQERSKQGLGPLAICPTLDNAAQMHAEAMKEEGFFEHENPFTGEDPSSRGEQAGYGPYVGENIAMGYQTPREVVRGWMDSPGHRENILSSYLHLGVGISNGGSGKYGPGGWFYWVQNFGSSGDC